MIGEQEAKTKGILFINTYASEGLTFTRRGLTWDQE